MFLILHKDREDRGVFGNQPVVPLTLRVVFFAYDSPMERVCFEWPQKSAAHETHERTRKKRRKSDGFSFVSFRVFRGQHSFAFIAASPLQDLCDLCDLCVKIRRLWAVAG
jgi:hypothetical protein